MIYPGGVKLRLIFAPTDIPSKSKGYLHGRVGLKTILPHLTR